MNHSSSSTPRPRPLCVVGFLLSIAPFFAACAPAAQATPPRAAAVDSRTITVIGRGEVTAKPDVARTNLGVEVTAPTLAEAMRTATARMSEVVSALKKAGIAEKDLQTSNFSVNVERFPEGPMPMPMPAPQPPRAGAIPKGAPMPAPVEMPRTREMYRVSNTVTATVRTLDQVGAVLDAAVAAGANSVWGVDFGLDKTDALDAQAREKAVFDARTRAALLARVQGVTLGEVVSVSEVVEGGMPFPMAQMSMKSSYAANTPVSPGEVALTAQVKVVYALTDGSGKHAR